MEDGRDACGQKERVFDAKEVADKKDYRPIQRERQFAAGGLWIAGVKLLQIHAIVDGVQALLGKPGFAEQAGEFAAARVTTAAEKRCSHFFMMRRRTDIFEILMDVRSLEFDTATKGKFNSFERRAMAQQSGKSHEAQWMTLEFSLLAEASARIERGSRARAMRR